MGRVDKKTKPNKANIGKGKGKKEKGKNESKSEFFRRVI